jgi:hypothetical protein
MSPRRAESDMKSNHERTIARPGRNAHSDGVDSLGKNLVIIGLTLALVGAALWVFGRNGGGLLPGDIVVERKNVKFYFPVVTCIVVSLVLSVIAWLMRR